MANGYMGKILWVDLSLRNLKEELLDEKLFRQFLGGYGLGAKILFNRMMAGVDPMGPENILGFLTGTFTGTRAIGGSRYAVVGKSPLTGSWGDANSGGFFGPHLRFAGYDGVFFTGISEEPVYLFLNNGKAELRSAAHLWGRDTYNTEDMLKSELGKDTEIACIGPAGEKRTRIAAVMNNKGRAAARSGLGAVMGSKKLKAIALKGNQKIPVFDEKRTSELRRKNLGEQTGLVSLIRDLGTCGLTVAALAHDDSPVKNWGGISIIDFPHFERFDAGPIIDRQTKKYACYQCPIGCGGHMKEGIGEYKYEAGVHKPEYETLAMFGSNCLNDNIESIIKLNDVCNRQGLDTISAGAVIAMAIECYENGLINGKDTDGVELTWGNHKAIVAMTEKLGKREGFGDILADGVKRAGEKIGKGSEQYAMHMQGQEYPAHDPKYGLKWAIAYRMDATPARHTQGGGVNPPGLPLPELDARAIRGRGEAQKVLMSFNHVINSTGMCQIVYGTFSSVYTVVDFMNSITGWDVTLEELLKTGERIANIRQAFNVREGLNPLEYRIPGRIVGKPPKEEGPLAGITLDEETMDREFCAAMDWDPKTARPNKGKLLELGLEDVATELWP